MWGGGVAETPKHLDLFLSEIDDISQPQRGDLLQGTVISIGPQGAVIDLGLKRDGVVPGSDLAKIPAEEGEIKVGDTIAVLVIDINDQDGNLAVSISQARESDDWLRAMELMEKETILEATPSGFNRGGLIVPFGRLRAFVPASHLSDLPRGLDEDMRSEFLDRWVGQPMPFRVIEVDPKRRRLVLSERKAIRQWRQEQKARIIETLKQGEVRKGVVTSLREFGAFVDIGGADGLIHISELSWQRVDNPASVLSEGQEVETLVISLDKKANRIGLSLKRLQPSPWEEAVGKITQGQEFVGKVSRISSAGAFVELDSGLEGLLRLPEGVSVPDKGEVVEVRVADFNPERERLDLDWVGASEPEPEIANEEDGSMEPMPEGKGGEES